MRHLPVLRLPALVRGWAARSRGHSRSRSKVRVAVVVAALLALALTGANVAGSAARAATEGPYGGTAAAVPGAVYAENYDTGGQGVAYNVTSVNGTDNGYRSDGVDLEATTDAGGPANDLGWTAAGQWFKYTVNVTTAGTYTVGLRLAAPSRGRRRPAHRQQRRNQPERQHRRPGHRRLADLGHRHGDRDAARGHPDPDRGPGQRRLEHQLPRLRPEPRAAGPRRRAARLRTAGPRRRCPAPSRRRTTTPAGRASPTTSPRSTARPTATAPTGSTWRPPPTPAAATTWAGPRPGSGSSTPSTSPPRAPTRSACGWPRPARSPTPCTSTTAPART